MSNKLAKDHAAQWWHTHDIRRPYFNNTTVNSLFGPSVPTLSSSSAHKVHKVHINTERRKGFINRVI